MKIYLKRFVLIQVILILALSCFALSPEARGVCQEGCNFPLQNTFLGDDTLISVTTGVGNTAIGFNALFSDTSGYANTAIGWSALYSDTTGTANTATGVNALSANTTGYFNTATGDQALQFNTTGNDNTATGFEALGSNTTGSGNTAIGENALEFNTTGNYNTAIGNGALNTSTTGNFNTAFGFNALLFNTTGADNIAVGFGAGIDVTTGSHNIDIGNHGRRGDFNTIRIGAVQRQTATFIAGINGATVPTGIAVIVDASGHLGTITSSARFKESIKPMDKASEAILALKPVTFRYKHNLDPNGIRQFGLVAEQVEKVNPDLVARDKDGKPYTVRYEAVNAMLLNEFLKEHRKGEQQDRKIEELESIVAKLQSALKEQASQIQKVSAQLEASKPASQVVNNP